MARAILIVEDNALIAADIALLVERALGYETRCAANVREAMTMADKDIAFAFLDVEVPDGPSFPVAGLLKEMHVPFVFVSGSDPSRVPQDLSDVTFLRKPVMASRLIASAEKYLAA
jgi:DNA-binding NtrC family response regulator